MRNSAINLVIFVLLFLGSAGAATLRIRILDENGRPAAARVEALDSTGAPLPMPTGLLPVHPRNARLGVIVDRQGEVELPAGTGRLRISRGGEYIPVEIEVSREAEVRLRRWTDMAKAGWWSGDMHVHRAPADMRLLTEAAGVHFAPDITRWNDQSNLASWPEGRNYVVNNCEDERGWGAALFFGLPSPVRLYSNKANREYPAAAPIWREARETGGYIDLEKTIWWGAPVAAALVPPDSIGVAVNHFIEDRVMDNEAWGRPRDLAKYPGQSGFANYIFDLYYAYLNSGLRVPASAGSANGVIHNPLGYNRSYVYLGRAFSPESWIAGEKAARNFVTNGPMLLLQVDGSMPGAVLAGSREATVRFEATAFGDLDRVEIVQDGDVVQTFRPGKDAHRISGSMRLRPRAGGWVAARCFERSPVTVRFAHTSPVYFGTGARRVPAALAFLRDWVDADAARIRGLESLTPAQKEELLADCGRARRRYER